MKLGDLPVIYLCPDHGTKYKARKRHMDALLTRIGFKDITHFKSSTEVYPRCLLKATIEVLSTHLDDTPILILEDDVEEFVPLHANTELVIPEDADAFYLGFSKLGGHNSENKHEGNAKIQVTNPYLRIVNMLGGHAVIYKSRRYKERVIQELRDVLHIPKLHKDILLSRIQHEYTIYGYLYPFFYQSAQLGNTQNVQDMTKFRYNTKGIPIEAEQQCSIV